MGLLRRKQDSDIESIKADLLSETLWPGRDIEAFSESHLFTAIVSLIGRHDTCVNVLSVSQVEMQCMIESHARVKLKEPNSLTYNSFSASS
jgi:hypothetical protein